MRRIHFWLLASAVVASVALAGWLSPQADSMCGYFRPIIVDVKNPSEMLQPSQIAFITWDPETKKETVTVQPRFEGNAADFGMVIPTPSQPKLHEMPRDFFKALGVFTTAKKRMFPESKLMPRMFPPMGGRFGAPGAARDMAGGGAGKVAPEEDKTTIEVLEVGQVGNLDYKIIAAGRSDDLFKWLKDNKYSYDGDEATLNYYVQKKYVFTVMKIDTLQMKRNKDGTFVGDVTPTRFTFTSEKLVYPTRITQVSVKDTTDAVFYVQAPFKMDLPGDLSYQYQWVSALIQIQGQMGEQELTEANRKWIKAIGPDIMTVINQGGKLGFNFNLGQELRPNKDGRHATTLEWAKRITAADVQVITGDRPFSETVPDPDDGFTQADMRDPQRSVAIQKIIQARLNKYQKEQPRGYLTRTAKKEDLKTLPILKGHVQPDQYITKFRHTFTRAEMTDDLVLVQAKVGDTADTSESEEVLRHMLFGRGRFGPGFGPGLPPPPGLPGGGLRPVPGGAR
jgi:hypothetical protein